MKLHNTQRHERVARATGACDLLVAQYRAGYICARQFLARTEGPRRVLATEAPMSSHLRWVEYQRRLASESMLTN